MLPKGHRMSALEQPDGQDEQEPEVCNTSTTVWHQRARWGGRTCEVPENILQYILQHANLILT